MSKTATKLKFVKVQNWYGNLSRYEARVEHPVNPGRYILEACPSDVYENRITGYTIRWKSDSDLGDYRKTRQIGSRNLRFGKGEKYLADAKRAAEVDYNERESHLCGFCQQNAGLHFVLTYCGMRWLCEDCLKTNA